MGGTVILASDRQAICEVPQMQYQAGDTLSVDGTPVHIIAFERIPAGGTTSAVKSFIRGGYAATRPTMSQARQFALLIAELSPEVRRAFMASVTDLQSQVDWPALLDALERMDTPAAIAALHIDPAAWAVYSAKVSEVYAKPRRPRSRRSRRRVLAASECGSV